MRNSAREQLVANAFFKGTQIRMINSAAFLKIRRRVMKQLAPDFSERKGSYSREVGSQLHCLQFASGKWGNEFSVDIGIHFTWLPSFEAFDFSPKPQHPEPATCCFKRRWRNDVGEQLFPYGDSIEVAEQFVSKIVSDCLAAFDQFNTAWADGSDLIDKLPPETLQSDAVLFKQLFDCRELDEKERLSNEMEIRKMFPEWFPHVSPMCVMLAYLAKKRGDLRRVSEYIAITSAPGQGHIISRARPLIEALGKLS